MKRSAPSTVQARRVRRRRPSRPMRRRRKFIRTRLGKAVKSVILATSETKKARYNLGTVEMFHNLSHYHAALLSNIVQGVQDPDAVLGSSACRIGDEIYLKGISFKFLFRYYPPAYDAQVRLYFFTYQQQVTLSDGAFWLGLNSAGSSMDRRLDTVNTEVGIKILKKYTFKPKGINVENNQYLEQSHKVFLPFNRKIQYENSSDRPRNRNIGIAMVAHNHDFNAGLLPLMHVQCIMTTYFKDP